MCCRDVLVRPEWCPVAATGISNEEHTEALEHRARYYATCRASGLENIDRLRRAQYSRFIGLVHADTLSAVIRIDRDGEGASTMRSTKLRETPTEKGLVAFA